MDYKKTLLIPTTLFKMKINLSEKEKEIQENWLKNGLVKKIYLRNKDNFQFVLHDGPPYANGDLHIGHALNKVLKDFIVRYHNQKGDYSPLICGWDTHGLPVEIAVEKSGVNRKQVSPLEFRNICRKYVFKQIENQKDQFLRLGLLTDFENKYTTLDFEYELTQLNLFNNMVRKKLVYYGLKPVYWSCSSESALAESEVEYIDLSLPSMYFTFLVVGKNDFLPVNTKVIVWTTTPWTIPMNQLLTVGENIVYCVVNVNNNNYLLAKNLVFDIANIIGWKSYKICSEFLGNKLVNLKTRHPLYNKISKIFLSDHVDINVGTGVVHIASGFGEIDYEIAKKNNIEVFAPINEEGKYTKDVNDEELIGVFYEDANRIIENRLRKTGNLLKLKSIKHKHPVDWRTKKPLIYRATSQWFVSIKNIKSELISKISQINLIPNWSKKRMIDMINNRNDWCISRQRVWGVPIIAFYDKNNKVQIDCEIIEYVINLFKREKTTDIWFEWTTDMLLPYKYKNKGWNKEISTMDVWFDSGVSNLVISELYCLNYPFALFLEGTDQFRGWFNSSLICSVINNDSVPCKTIISHGFVNDEFGKKMSKSLGNVIDPQDIIKKYGSDVLRMWVSSVNYYDDVRIGEGILKHVSESYFKIRNTLKFLLANLSDFDSRTDIVEKFDEVDLYVLCLTKSFKDKIISYYEEFNFNSIFNLINNFVAVTLSRFYLDFIKDIIYIEETNSCRRRSVQTTLYYIFRTLVDVLKPIVPHTVEEVHDYVKYDKEESVHLEKYFSFNISGVSKELIVKWEKILKLRDDVNKELENKRKQKIITKSLSCKLIINLKDSYKELKNVKNLHQIFIVSEVIFTDDCSGLNEYETSFLIAKEKEGFKCKRCWLIVNELSKNNEICKRCFGILKFK